MGKRTDFQAFWLGLFLICTSPSGGVWARDCYFCTYSENGAQLGHECVTSPTNYTLAQNTVTCQDDMHCFVQTRIYTMTGTIYTFGRGCGLQEPLCEENLHFKTCIYTCHGHLCNTRIDDVGTLRALPSDRSESGGKPRRRTKQRKTNMATSRSDFTWCYSCTYSYHPVADDTCITDPENLDPVGGYPVQCPHQTTSGCVTYRQWDKGEEVIRSSFRGCQYTVPPGDYCEEDTHFVSCYYFCDTDYCNDEDHSTEVESISTTMLTWLPRYGAKRKDMTEAPPIGGPPSPDGANSPRAFRRDVLIVVALWLLFSRQ